MRNRMIEVQYQPVVVTVDGYGAPIRTYGAAQTVLAATSRNDTIEENNGIRIVKQEVVMITDFEPNKGDKLNTYIVQDVRGSNPYGGGFYYSTCIKETPSDA